MTSSRTLQTATGFGPGVLAPGKPYDGSLVKLRLLDGLHETSQEVVATPTTSKVKGTIFRCPEHCTQISAKASLGSSGLGKVHALP